MPIKRLSVIVIVSCTMLSCNSFNHTTISYGNYPIGPGVASATHKASSAAIAQSALSDEATKSASIRDTDAGVASVADGQNPNQPNQVSVLCPIYKLPALATMPPLPYKQLDQAGNDQKKIDEVVRKHIMDLRSYASNVKNAIVTSHEQYLKACQEYLANSHQNSLGQ